MGSVQPASREPKTRAPVRANSVSNPTSLSAPSANKICCEVRGKTLLSANSEALLTSLTGKALHNRAKFVSNGRTKVAEVTSLGEATLASPMAKKKALKAKPKAFQPQRVNIKSP